MEAESGEGGKAQKEHLCAVKSPSLCLLLVNNLCFAAFAIETLIFCISKTCVCFLNRKMNLSTVILNFAS